MPFLEDEQVQELLTLARFLPPCDGCGGTIAKDYCRSCDEFYWLHAPGCLRGGEKHAGHRLTIVPFVEDRGFVLPTYCYSCGAYLMGGATEHKPGCEILTLIKEASR